MKEWSEAIKACSEFAKEVELTEKDAEQAINEVRNKDKFEDVYKVGEKLAETLDIKDSEDVKRLLKGLR